MHKYTLTNHIFLLFFLFLSLNSEAQKLQIKSILHKQYLPGDDNKLILTSQKKKEFNLFNKLALQEEYSLNKSKQLDLVRQQRLSYDPKGRHQNTLEYNKEGILQAETKIHWDAYNNKSKVEQIQYDDGQQTSVAVTYLLEYNEDGDKEQEKFFLPDGTPIKGKTWFYNNQKEVNKTLTWIEKRKEPRKEILTLYKRNKNGDLVQSITTEKVNDKEFRKDIRYFSKNYVIEWKTFIEGKLESHFINEYRDSVIIRTTRQNKRKILSIEAAARERERLEKRQKKNERITKESDIFITNTEYDAYGNILVTTQSTHDKVITVTQYAYDDYGNQVKMLKIDKENDIKEEELNEYDEWGNVSKTIQKKNDKIIQEDFYIYEYFPRE